ncbi:hypothetical protein [Streptomyces sp. NPDC004579]|uniref:hypothetical protein n=1 Tax=Streptomyces sp. NPDC004579 TaxID=3154667 RepID=UPI0033BCDA6F
MPAVPTAVTTSLTQRIAVRARRGRYVLPLSICALYAVFQLVAAPQWTMFPDSYRYARAAEQHLGVSREEAHRTALAAFCVSRADRTAHDERLRPMEHASLPALRTTAEHACLKRWTDAPDITTGDPRYQAIFAGRPGYPLLAAPFVGAFGVLDGMWLLGLVLAAVGSLLVFGLLGRAGLNRRAAAVGQVAFLATPLGWWSAQALSEGLFTVCVLCVLWGGLLLLRRRSMAKGTALVALGYVAGGVTRYSSALVLAVVLGVAATWALCRGRSSRHRGTAVLAVSSAVAAGGVVAAIRILGLASSQATLQDTFTHHFETPEIADPWSELMGLAGRFAGDWIAQQAALPYFLVLTALAAWALARHGKGLGLLSLAAALTGACAVLAHPLVQEADRLGVLMWTPVVLGLPLVVDRHWSSVRVAGVPATEAAVAEVPVTEVAVAEVPVTEVEATETELRRTGAADAG